MLGKVVVGVQPRRDYSVIHARIDASVAFSRAFLLNGISSGLAR